MKPNNADAGRLLARHFEQRAKAQHMTRGKRRDVAALEFWAGGLALAMAHGDTLLADHLARVGVLVIALRGYAGIAEIAAQPLSIEIEATAHHAEPVRAGAH